MCSAVNMELEAECCRSTDLPLHSLIFIPEMKFEHMLHKTFLVFPSLHVLYGSWGHFLQILVRLSSLGKYNINYKKALSSLNLYHPLFYGGNFKFSKVVASDLLVSVDYYMEI